MTKVEAVSIEGRELEFDLYLREIKLSYEGHKNDWIDPLINEWKDYLYGTMLIDENEDIYAFGFIQDFGSGMVRILTRTWVDPDRRSKAMRREFSIGPLIAEHQLNWLKTQNYSRAIFTFENRGVNALKFTSKRIMKKTGLEFKIQPDKIKTFEGATPEQYQIWAMLEL